MCTYLHIELSKESAVFIKRKNKNKNGRDCNVITEQLPLLNHDGLHTYWIYGHTLNMQLHNFF